MVEEVYVSFEVAKLLKEKGFDEDCYTFYEYDSGDFYREERNPCCNSCSDDYAAPTQQRAMKWLREKHRLHIDIDPSESDWNPTVITLEDWTCIVKYGDKIPVQDTYEEACEAAIKYCLENLI